MRKENDKKMKNEMIQRLENKLYKDDEMIQR